MENMEKTIDSICNWIQKRLEVDMALVEDQRDTAEMTRALAELLSAKAKADVTFEVKTSIEQNNVDLQRLKEKIKKAVSKNLF